ncbi:PHD finger protein ALFIN-LIKE 7-like [Apium graveolens]|uniref:PHD finger protein ALFIN-LIKE 7-like n=1 Tax=Apium graveolens TaxID=4045 RepID=UPI003D78D5D8
MANRPMLYGSIIPNTVQEIYDDYIGRRAGLITTLSTGHENQCLYGMPNQTWELNNNDKPELLMPDPSKCFGIVSYDIDKECITSVANHCDTWLLDLANNFADRFPLSETQRQRLQNMISQEIMVSANIYGDSD